MRLYWISGVGMLMTIGSWGNSSSSSTQGYDPAHRAALEGRLQDLQTKKAELEEVPGSLDLQRQYQARIDRLALRLGHGTNPLSEESSPQTSIAAHTYEEGGEVDYFHDRSQIVAVDRSIHDHGGIRPHSSLLEELPRTNLRRAVSEPPKRGVVIDGDTSAPSVSAVSQGINLSPSFQPLPQPSPEDQSYTAEQNAALLTSFNGRPEASFPSSPSTGKKEEERGASDQPLALPSGGRPPSLWNQTASYQDYTNKAGWSATPPPITMPLFYAPPSGAALGAMGQTQSPPVGEGPADPRFSFSPRHLMRSWHHG